MSRRPRGPEDEVPPLWPGPSPLPGKPVAMTVTRISSCKVSSMTAPKMITASGSAASADDFGRLVYLKKAQIAAARDLEEDASGPFDRRFQQGTGDGLLGRLDGAVLSRRRPMPIKAEPALVMIVRTSAKSRLIQARHRDEVRNPLHPLSEYVVGDFKRLDHRGALDRPLAAVDRWG